MVKQNVNKDRQPQMLSKILLKPLGFQFFSQAEIQFILQNPQQFITPDIHAPNQPASFEEIV